LIRHLLWGKDTAAQTIREVILTISLVPIYGWFTEGFDTADLQEAKVLLEALA
jgi:hypothetical protein